MICANHLNYSGSTPAEAHNQQPYYLLLLVLNSISDFTGLRVSRHRFNIRSLLTNSKSFETFKSSVSLGRYEGKTNLRRRAGKKLII